MTYLLLDRAHGAAPYLMALSAASFIYIAAVDLMPGLHRKTGPRGALARCSCCSRGSGRSRCSISEAELMTVLS